MVSMALGGVSYSLIQGRIEPRGQLCCSISTSISSSQSSHIKFHPSPITSLEGPTGAGVSSGSWAGRRQLEVLYKSRVRRRGLLYKNGTGQGLTIKALQGGGRPPRRLVDAIRAIPKISRVYFKSPFRRALYGGISLLGGFYVAQTISLSFGALGVNDVIAAALCVLFAEYVTKFYHTRLQMTFSVALLNNFKMGLTYGLFIDAFKLAS